MIKSKYGSLVLLGAALLLPALAVAQDDERTFVSVRTVHVKASMAKEFVELQKQLNEAARTAGEPGRQVWQEVRGELGTFHIVGGLDNFATYDEASDPPMDEEAWAAWVDAILDTTSSSARMVLRTHPEFSIPADEGSEPGLLILRYTTVAPGKGGDYHDWVENKLSPALKAGGATGVSFNHVAVGGNTNLWISGSRIDNWADLDTRGPLAGMSDEDRDALFANYSDMVWESDVRILSFRADLSRDGPTED